ncbi:SMI1/KNR4 family protein [Rubripirellula reticaptiva]|uniref:Knr4/Smi1-like domain-containing protein n=1 Tax=Rubripirellula reticaptiva TaxID=2528013 RepID=A0A5C6E6Z2_9BACT|nr:SMI1/KNR4 family protein [Rubripirellula reticaptiva]TWU44570.1 hypothetical protein Poly59_61330 [Rubripirellula reticaptiva]
MAIESQLDRIAEKFERLRDSDPRCRVGSSGEHQYELNVPISEQELAELERSHGVELPTDYRAFITTFSNGGAGPIYGQFTVQDAFAEYLTPSKPFPYETGCRIEYSHSHSGDDLKRLREFYKDPANQYGKIVLGEMGDGMMTDLIVTGMARGQVWIDDRTTEWGGLYPCDTFGNKEPLCFVDWYETWLDRAIARKDVP